jgi:hypothetical protein
VHPLVSVSLILALCSNSKLTPVRLPFEDAKEKSTGIKIK